LTDTLDGGIFSIGSAQSIRYTMETPRVITVTLRIKLL